MSRIGRMPVKIPAGVQVEVLGNRVQVKGPRGETSRLFPAGISFTRQGDALQVQRQTEDRRTRAFHGMSRALVQNMVLGVSKGFNRKLQVEGVGYRAEINAKSLVLSVGFSHPVVVDPPEGIVFSVDEKTRIIEVSGYDKERVGQVAADLRKIRPPEPYKGKGIRYVGERVRHKAGKAGKATATK
ncbi:MAG: 50S ribosomal protein L6 [Anaerolineales bacterium]